MCHILFVLPWVSLILFVFLPLEQAAVLYAVILLPCAIFYRLAWKDMRRPAATGVEGMIGGGARVIRDGKRSKVLFQGEIWDAVCPEDLSVGESVEIAGLERMTLLVRRK